MTWDPDEIVVSEAFRSYVEELKKTHNYALGGDNAHTHSMNHTLSYGCGGTV